MRDTEPLVSAAEPPVQTAKKEDRPEQIEQLRESSREIQQRCDRSIAALNSIHSQEMARQDGQLRQFKGTCRNIAIALSIETPLFLAPAIFDVLNANIGRFR